MRSRFRRTGVSGSRRIVPFRVTRPPRMSSPALEREQKPSLDNARARPVLLFAPGKAFSARSFDCLWVLCLGVRTLQIAPLPGSLFYADGTVSSNKKNYIAVLKKERFGRKVRAGSVEEEGTTRPSPTASVLEAYHVVPPPSTSRNLLARTGILSNERCHIHTPNLVIVFTF